MTSCRTLLLVLFVGVVPWPGTQTLQAQTGFWDSTKDTTDRALRYLTMREQPDAERARELYQEGDQLFRSAAARMNQTQRDGETEGSEKKDFAKAAKLFARAADAQPESALAQDAMFMQAESLFFSDQLPDAADVYERLNKEFPNNRHVDQAAARAFSISQYWIDTEKATSDDWFKLNLFDASRPRLDTEGHAVRVLDQIRYDNPTGRLADDATMAAAVEYMRQGEFEMADEFLTDLRETFPESDHFFNAHLMGIRCKLEVFAGPKYSGLMLEEADKLVRQTRERFPDRLQDPETSEMVARAAAEVAFRRAEKLNDRAIYREKRSEYGAARVHYQKILRDYPSTPFADRARERLEAISSYPDVPAERMTATLLKRAFPDSRRSPPLETKFNSPSGKKNESIYR
ncbi:tetratricopeptide repeat protein [Rhodopirellula sp. JC740]|uniref:Tetratricopeptide repeat protein n=1 Tax=Rhodopirellula halodulae TaxID=2894198 RepID=A0ABS8NMH4_9BACT|nr:tetratricopeptide repeat protein [Rhodopirellula sp. JC740]